jgi:uncharacterized protein
LIINNLHFEPVKITKPMAVKMCDAIRDFATFNGCESISIVKCNNKPMLKTFKEYF